MLINKVMKIIEVKRMRFPTWNHLHKVLILASLFASLIWCPASEGRGFRLLKLPDKGENWGCATCHVNPFGGGPRHSFGIDYEVIALRAGDVYTAELGQTDSDGDGYSNDDEFNAQPATEPWNANSHPLGAPQGGELNGKTFSIWARLKSLRAAANWAQRSTHGHPGLEVRQAVKMSMTAIDRASSTLVKHNRSKAKGQRRELEKNATSKIEKVQKRLPTARGLDKK